MRPAIVAVATASTPPSAIADSSGSANDVQPGERDRDREAGDEHGTARAGDRPRPARRRPARPGSRCALLAEARDDQQAVVDGEPEPEQRDDVDGELADRHHARQRVERKQRARDRRQRGEQREPTGEHAAAEEHQHDGEDDERDRLPAHRVPRGLLGERALGQQLAADEHLGRVDRAQLRGDPVGDRERRVIVELRVELDDRERAALVTRDQPARRVGVTDLVDAREPCAARS